MADNIPTDTESTTEHVDTLIVGAGQAGLAMSEHLGLANIDHLVVERHQVAERWYSDRWDSLVANGPAWHDRFPSLAFATLSDDEFASRQDIIDYFNTYAKQISAPLRCGVDVQRVQRRMGQSGFRIDTSHGVVHANNVIAATGPFQLPVFPRLVADTVVEHQLHSSDYKSPEQLPDGAVLVVGAGSSGSQIADELNRAGKRVYLSVGPHDRPPRSYRERDFVWWLGVLGKWDATALAPGTEHVTIAVSGARGGHTVDFRQFAAQGITLLGMTKTCQEGVLNFADDLALNINNGDANYLSLLDEADAYIEGHGLDLPPEPAARIIADDPDCMSDPLRTLDLAQSNVTSIIWATGYASDYSWLKIDTFDENGKPQHQRGVSNEPGIYFLGLPWQSRRGSSFIWGVWHDAKYIADHIAKQKNYWHYRPAAQQQQ